MAVPAAGLSHGDETPGFASPARAGFALFSWVTPVSSAVLTAHRVSVSGIGHLYEKSETFARVAKDWRRSDRYLRLYVIRAELRRTGAVSGYVRARRLAPQRA